MMLDRRPRSRTLRAWDAADALLIEAVAEQPPSSGDRVLVVNDSFGALAVACRAWSPISWTDSCVAQLAAEANLAANLTGNPADHQFVEFRPSTESPVPLGVDPTMVLLRVGRSVGFVDQQIRELARHLVAGARVVVAGMDKHTPPASVAALSILGEVHRHRGRHKAHRFDVTVDGGAAARAGAVQPSGRVRNELGLDLLAGPNVFAHDRLDPGARVMAGLVPQMGSADQVLDLACGSGVLGILVARAQPSARVTFIDESHHAIAATRANIEANVVDPHRCVARVADGLSGHSDETFDLIVCNPPFHQGASTTDDLAATLLNAAAQRLAPGGELWVVGNRHLRHDQVLKRRLSSVEIMSKDPAFVVVRGRR